MERRDRFVGHSQAGGGQSQLRGASDVRPQTGRTIDPNVITEQVKYVTAPSSL